MNALAVQNPRHMGDFGNKNDSVTDKEIIADNVFKMPFLNGHNLVPSTKHKYLFFRHGR